MKKDHAIYKVSREGELIFPDSGDDIREKYRGDGFLHSSFLAVVVSLLCAVCDGALFLQLFNLISHDSIPITVCGVLGLLVAFDVNPLLFMGEIKRMRQGLVPRIPFFAVMMIGITAFAVLLNVGLRIATFDLAMPAAESTAKEASNRVQLIALTAFGCIVPVLTSTISGWIGYANSDPLRTRLMHAERRVQTKKEELRRLSALLNEHEQMSDYEDYLVGQDTCLFESHMTQIKNQMLAYCEYVRLKLMEHLHDASAYSALEVADYNKKLTERIDAEARALQGPQDLREKE